MHTSDLNDDLSDLLGGTRHYVAPKALPTDAGLARVRETAASVTESCPKCHGTGKFRGYSGRVLGDCFACKGAGSRTFKNAATVRAANRAAVATRKVAAATSNLDAFVAAFPAHHEWMVAKAPRFEFAASMLVAVGKYGSLTEKQQAAVERCMARDVARVAPVAAPVAAATTYPRIRAAFDAVVAKGAKKAQITIGDVNVSLASMSGRNPGALYVKVGGEYAGKIIGETLRGSYSAPADLATKLAEIEADPTGAVRAQAERTAKRLADAAARGEDLSIPCGCCGIMLTDPVSIARGIGPICAGKWGF